MRVRGPARRSRAGAALRCDALHAVRAVLRLPAHPAVRRIVGDRVSFAVSPSFRENVMANPFVHVDIGTIQATACQRRTASIAYVFAPLHWRHGYATEACCWLLSHLACELRIVQVRAIVDARNEPSWRLLERLQFVRSGQQVVAFRGQAATDYCYRLSQRRGPTRRSTQARAGDSSVPAARVG